MTWRSKGERFAAADCAHAAELGAPLLSYSTHVLLDAKTRTRDAHAVERIDARLADIQATARPRVGRDAGAC